MDENTPTGFKIGLDASEPEAGPSEPQKKPGKQRKAAPKTKKSRDPAMFIVFLGFLIILVAIGWLYYDINERLKTINKSGSEEVARLSQEMSSRFQTLDNQIAAVKKANQKQLASLETKLQDTDSRMNKLQSSISASETTLGSLKKDLNALQQSGQKMADLRETAQSIQTRQAEIESRLESNAAKIQTLTDKLQTLSETRVSTDMLDKALKEERAFYKENTAHATETLFSEIASLKKQIQTLQSSMAGLRERLVNLQEMPAPKEGEIVEQEIQ